MHTVIACCVSLVLCVAVALGATPSHALDEAQEICDNGLDDDLDGLADLRDKDCMIESRLRVRDDTFVLRVLPTLEASVARNDLLRDPPGSYSLEGEGPSSGQVEIDASTGRFRYTPQEGFVSGADQFTYRLTDSRGKYGTATVTLRLEAQAAPLVTEAWERNGELTVRGRFLRGGGPLLVRIGEFDEITVQPARIVASITPSTYEFSTQLPPQWQPGTFRLNVRNALGTDAFEVALGNSGIAGPPGERGPAGPPGPSGTGIEALLGKSCPAGQSLTGFSSEGGLLCSGDGGSDPGGTAFEQALSRVEDDYLRECITRAYPDAVSPAEVTELGCQYIRNLQGLDSFIELRHLAFLNNSFTGVDALAPMAALRKLEFVSFGDGTDILSIEPLRGLPIREFHIDHLQDEVGSTDVFNSWPYLEKLGIYYTGWTQVPALSDERAAALKLLILQATRISDLRPMVRMRNLEEFQFNYEYVEDVSVFTASNFPRLTRLGISNNPNLTDISSIATFTNLRYVSFRGNKISVLGNALDGISEGFIDLRGNPLLCSEYDAYMARKPAAVTVNYERNECVE